MRTVCIENVTRQTPLAERARVANNFWTRLRGLIGVSDLPDGEGMMIQPCNSVHCMFMSIPIDVVYVDKQHRVVAVDHAMKPWRVGRIRRQSRYVVELPAGRAVRTQTQVGDQLNIIEERASTVGPGAISESTILDSKSSNLRG